MKYRIRKYDSLNWTVEGLKLGGVAGSGIAEGTISKDHWVVLGYYGDLKSLTEGLLDDAILDLGEVVGPDILERIDRAGRFASRLVSEAASDGFSSEQEHLDLLGEVP